MHEPEPLVLTRIVAAPAALDAVAAPGVALRTAPDELLLLGEHAPAVADADAIVVRDAGFAGAWWTRAETEEALAVHADWALPAAGVAQGALAGLPVRMLADGDRVLVLVPAPFLDEARERLA